MKALLAALQRMHTAVDGQAPASQFTAAQRKALDQFVQQTQAIACKTSGRGIIYKVLRPQVVKQHLRNLSPDSLTELPALIPNRAANIAAYRNSKGGDHRHNAYYLLMKAQGDKVQWSDTGNQLDLSEASVCYGASVLAINEGDFWGSAQPLWLVENQALFDCIDWLPDSTQCSIHWYRGQINNNLLDWLAGRKRVPEVILFPDYDGVGLQNYARLHQRIGDQCSLWLMPDWEAKLGVYGSNQIWRDTRRDFEAAVDYLSRAISPQNDQGPDLQRLFTALRTEGLALEQEAVWL